MIDQKIPSIGEAYVYGGYADTREKLAIGNGVRLAYRYNRRWRSRLFLGHNSMSRIYTHIWDQPFIYNGEAPISSKSAVNYFYISGLIDFMILRSSKVNFWVSYGMFGNLFINSKEKSTYANGSKSNSNYVPIGDNSSLSVYYYSLIFEAKLSDKVVISMEPYAKLEGRFSAGVVLGAHLHF